MDVHYVQHKYTPLLSYCYQLLSLNKSSHNSLVVFDFCQTQELSLRKEGNFSFPIMVVQAGISSRSLLTYIIVHSLLL
jgi:hypothetical protein